MNTIQVLLAKTKERVEELSSKGVKICINENAMSCAEEKFKEFYDKFMDDHMCDQVECLDRHKVAAIFIKTIIDEKIIISEIKERKNYMSVASEMIATEIALSWMMSELNEILVQHSLNKIERYSMPIAFACSTPYFEVFCRNLHNASESYCVNPIDIADKFFLLEYITLLENNIPCDKIREW